MQKTTLLNPKQVITRQTMTPAAQTITQKHSNRLTALSNVSQNQ
jgi:hypothetical protein